MQVEWVERGPAIGQQTASVGKSGVRMVWTGQGTSDPSLMRWHNLPV